MNPKYLLYCQNCGLKHYTDGSDTTGMVEVKQAPVPKRADGKDRSTTTMGRKLKCYNCGHLFKVSKTPGAAAPKPAERKREEPPPIADPEEYLKQWEQESLKSVRNRPKP